MTTVQVRRSGKRGRPRLDITFERIVLAVVQHQGVMPAAKSLGCSPAFIHAQLKRRALTLRQLLDHPKARELAARLRGDRPGP